MFYSLKKFYTGVRVLFGKEKIEAAGKGGKIELTTKIKVQVSLQFIISIAILGISIYLLSNTNTSNDLKDFAKGGIGAIIVYWLR